PGSGGWGRRLQGDAPRGRPIRKRPSLREVGVPPSGGPGDRIPPEGGTPTEGVATSKSPGQDAKRKGNSEIRLESAPDRGSRHRPARPDSRHVPDNFVMIRPTAADQNHITCHEAVGNVTGSFPP